MRYACPCCGYLTYKNKPEEYDICPVCYWECDHVQERDEEFWGGANVPSLKQARINFLEFGAIEEKFIQNVRKPLKKEIKKIEQI